MNLNNDKLTKYPTCGNITAAFSGTTLGEDLLCDQEILLASNENLFQSFEERASGISHADVTTASGKEDELSFSWDINAEEFLSTELGSNAGDAGFVTETGPKGLSALSSDEVAATNLELFSDTVTPLVSDCLFISADCLLWAPPHSRRSILFLFFSFQGFIFRPAYLSGADSRGR